MGNNITVSSNSCSINECPAAIDKNAILKMEKETLQNAARTLGIKPEELGSLDNNGKLVLSPKGKTKLIAFIENKLDKNGSTGYIPINDIIDLAINNDTDVLEKVRVTQELRQKSK